MKKVNASIITIGDELLIGQTIDTNSAFIAQELNKIGVWVRHRTAVGDVWDDIWNALDDESKSSDIIIVTGGLGPTADDITKPLLCKYFGGKLVVNERVLNHVKYLFEKVFRRPGPILERNLKQAEVPDVCEVLFNKRGTAPGMLFRKAILNPLQGEASPNPSKGGASDPDNLENHYSYATANPIVYGLLKNFVAEHRTNPTEAENILWEIVRGRKMAGFKFRRQHIISEYIADFVCISEKLIIEVDGLHHQLYENKISDEERTYKLNTLGFEVLRFTNFQVLSETDSVINTIITRLKERKAKLSTTQDPPLGGRGAKVFISLPGVPTEMKGLMLDEVIPRLKNEFDLPAIVHKTAFTAGMGESMIAERLVELEASLPSHIKLAYLPNYGMVRLRLTSTGDDKIEMEAELSPLFEQLKEKVKDVLVSDEDEGLEIVLGKVLKARSKTMATAESCTGGYIAQLITSVPGSSAYFSGSIVSYANSVKENVLDVSANTLKNFGAVSEETVTEMLKGVINKLDVDYAVAVSGIMGPDGGSAEKSVGLVWVAVGNKEKTQATKLQFRFDRMRNIEMTAQNAMNLLRKFILEN